MSYSALSDLCIQPTLIAPTEKYKRLVYDSTTELVQFMQCIVTALDRRAMGLSKCASYELALADANLMQQLSSISALGYMREAMIYSEQGKQRHVIDICDRALSVVDPNDPHYATLQQMQLDAEQRVNTRIDFIRQLPADIVLTTLIPMFMNNGDRLVPFRPYQYLHVSNLWRNRIVQCIGGLDLIIHEKEEDNTHSTVIEFAQHTKSLRIDKYTGGPWLGDLLRENDFCSLNALYIQLFTNDMVDHFVSSLKAVSNTLTKLEISLEFDRCVSLATMLSTCPNLTWLKISAPYNIDLSSQPETTWPNLTHLYISDVQARITYDHIIGIWKRLPSLVELKLHPCNDMPSAAIVTDYYPSMKVIQVEMTDSHTEITYKQRGLSKGEIGITYISVSQYAWFEESTANISPLLNKYCNTLEQLDLNMDLDNDDSYHVQYPQLRKVVLSSSAWWIPRNAPMLQDLALSSKTIAAHPEVLDTIPPNLKILQLRLASDPILVDKAPLESYLHRLVQQYQLSTLIVYFDIRDSIGTLLDAICYLGQLQSLVIHFWASWDTNQMEEFFSKLVIRCTHLCSLRINCYNTPTPKSIHTLKRLGQLRELAFSVDRFTNDHFWHEIQTFSHLKRISIYQAYLDTNGCITYLKTQRPDMEIIEDYYYTEY